MKEEIKQKINLIKNGQVPQGYKKTKVGILPEDWEITTLQNIGNFKKGKEVCGNNIIDDGLPAMMYGDIYVKYDIKFYNVDYRISEETAKKSTTVYKNDLLFTCSGETSLEIGKCVCYLGDETIYIGGDILAFTPYNCDSLFISYQQNLFNMIKEKARYGQGHSVVHIYLNSISKLSVFLPPLKEQQKIADILTTQDKIIELKQKLIEEKEKQKKYLMQNLLTGKIRLKGFKDKWEKVKIGNVFTVTRGNVIPLKKLKRIKDDEFLYPVYSSQTKNKGLLGYYKEYLYEDAITWTTDGANAGDVNFRKGKFYCTNVCGVLLSSKINTNICIAEILNRVTKSYVSYVGNPKLMNNIMENINIKIPPLQEQNKIAQILSKADEEIELLQKELEQEKQKKKALMQLLLTGIVRV